MSLSAADRSSEFIRVFGSEAPLLEAVAPYRLSPLGAHTDYQRGLTTGFALDCALRLVFRARSDTRIRVVSCDVEGQAEFDLTSDETSIAGFGAYVFGVARELHRRAPIQRGIDGMIFGELPSGGVSSSAALGIATLLALETAGERESDRPARVDCVVSAERREAGVEVGILDPTVILYGRRNALVVIDCDGGDPRLQHFAKILPAHEWILVDSGVARSLRSSPYNDRVAECRAAALALGAPQHAPFLRRVTPEHFRRERARLDPILRARAEHVFSENKRVRHGVSALSEGDLRGFAALINASEMSLTRDFECGTPETKWLLAKLRRHPGVLAASYAGGGFGGHLQVLAEPGTTSGLSDALRPDYALMYREAAANLSVHLVHSGEGARVERFSE